MPDDLGRAEMLAPFLCIAVLAVLGAYRPRLWPLGIFAGVLMLVLLIEGPK